MKLVVGIYYGEDTAPVNIRWLMTSQIGSTENIIYNLHIYKIDFNIDKGKNDYENSVRKNGFCLSKADQDEVVSKSLKNYFDLTVVQLGYLS